MTHIEVMHFHPDTLEPGTYLFLFDYKKRDTLTFAAKYQDITRECETITEICEGK